MQFREKTRKRITINITSLIDVLFLLLIFFMVSSTFVEQPAMKLDLPKTEGHEPIRLEGHTLYITKDERLFLDDTPVLLQGLPERIQAIAPDVGEQGLLLKGDEGVRFGLVVEVMDLLKQGGISRLVIGTEPKKKDAPKEKNLP